MEVVLPDQTLEFLLKRESYYIRKFDSVRNGYNNSYPKDIDKYLKDYASLLLWYYSELPNLTSEFEIDRYRKTIKNINQIMEETSRRYKVPLRSINPNRRTA
jgi:hypothetical protein